jgi:5-methylcytosine-specific restriction enzyme A
VEAGVRYLGEAVYTGHRVTRGPDKNGDDRKVFVFELAVQPDDAGEAATDIVTPEHGPPGSISLAELRRRALEEAPAGASASEQRRTVYKRSKAVREYVLKRAEGTCESCEAGAPFVRPDGSPYLEPHHIRRLGDGGPDHPRWVAAVCPTCHARIHRGRDGAELNAALGARVGGIEG